LSLSVLKDATTLDVMKPTPLFDPGRVVATPGAIHLMAERRVDPLQLLWRHVTGDWGDLCDEDKLANDRAVNADLRILSAYRFGDRDKLYVITEHDRSVTTLLLPSEY
jgi:hypothetical protein